MTWPFWYEALLRSTALLLAGALLLRFSKTRSAAFRHALLLSVAVLLGLLPLLSILCPAIHLPLPTPAHSLQAIVTVQELSSTVAGQPVPHAFNWAVAIWLTGLTVTLISLLTGALSAWRLARRAVPVSSSTMIDIQNLRNVEILVSQDLSIPLTSGLLRPRILLPAAAVAWTPLRLRAVLSHELAHARRRDVAAQVAVHLIAALWWFQPLVWLLRRRLRIESELACDAAALKAGLCPSEYGAELLAVARTLNRRVLAFNSCGIGMACSSDLEHRLRAILKPPAISVSRPKTFAVVLTLAAAAIAASAFTPRPSQFNEPGGSLMKRTLLSGLLTSVGLSAASISGALHDAGGAAIPGATVTVYNPDTGSKQEAVTDSDGRFTASGDAAGQYILRIEKPGFASIFREFDLKAESAMERQFTMSNEGGEPVADHVTSNSEPAGRPVRVGGQIAQTNLTTKVQPVYPASAKANHVQGAVEIETTISKDGIPVELRVIASPSDDLSEASLEAVRQWRYRPTLLNGEPVAIVTDVLVNYTLSQ